jgi:hypothetical protein
VFARSLGRQVRSRGSPAKCGEFWEEAGQIVNRVIRGLWGELGWPSQGVDGFRAGVTRGGSGTLGGIWEPLQQLVAGL